MTMHLTAEISAIRFMIVEIKERVGAKEIEYKKIDKPTGKAQYKETVIKFKFEKA